MPAMAARPLVAVLDTNVVIAAMLRPLASRHVLTRGAQGRRVAGLPH